MIDEFGPYAQMATLGEQMANRYQMDENLELEPHLAHYMEEVEVNIAADSFNHVGFMNKILVRLKSAPAADDEPRRQEFLQAVTVALQERIDHAARDVALSGI
ncbi:hypothetical protein ASF91_10705 [Rhizobium sp. Leaf155]|uniref:hypothetical protein n=1 Tax=Agrobacterium cavarae TaxID=2528239 RepID=UPI000712A6BC|nr:hypothetical protein [Agrobacterium cavarae]KQR32057.1 hypothetical protein ASF91_10705 [Rhizobium sp. Leaf155]